MYYPFDPCDTAAASIFQQAINIVIDWASSWGLQISTEKTQILHIGKKNPKHTYFVHGCALVPVEIAKDLGVLMSGSLLFRDHYTHIIQQTLFAINDFFRTYKTRDLNILVTAYKTYFRCKLEYCTELWNPQDVFSVNLIENVQRYFTRRVCQRIGRTLSYPQRLELLNLQTLEYRRFLNDITYIHKFIHSKTILDYQGLFTIIPTRSRNSNEFRIVPSFDNNGQISTFISRAFSTWNALPSDVVHIRDHTSFKQHLSSLELMALSKIRRI